MTDELKTKVIKEPKPQTTLEKQESRRVSGGRSEEGCRKGGFGNSQRKEGIRKRI